MTQRSGKDNIRKRNFRKIVFKMRKGGRTMAYSARQAFLQRTAGSGAQLSELSEGC